MKKEIGCIQINSRDLLQTDELGSQLRQKRQTGDIMSKEKLVKVKFTDDELERLHTIINMGCDAINDRFEDDIDKCDKCPFNNNLKCRVKVKILNALKES